MTEGSVQGLSAPNTLLIGYKLARRLSLHVGDRLKIMAAESQPTAFGFFPKTRYFRIVGLFNSGMHEYDQGFVFMPLSSAQDFFELPQKMTGLEIFVDNPEGIEQIKQQIMRFLPQYASVYDWQQANLHFFNAIQVQRNVMFFILTLIVLVAVFNIISCLVMLVKDKTRDIAILNTMGATRSMILKTFLLIGSSIGVTGTLAGSLLGLAFSYNIDRIKHFLETLTGVELFESEIYFLAHLPSKVSLPQVFLVISTSLMLSFLATLYPAWKASRLNPIQGLRYA
jgi:lipoprotein-releasing system permease protein